MAWAGSRGEGRSWQPPGWKAKRRRILARDHHRCVECGSTDRLEIHHADGDHDNHEDSNLVTLCHGCHDRHTIEQRNLRMRRNREREPHPGLIR